MRLVLLTALAALAPAAPAAATTVQVSTLGSAVMTIDAEPGEANDISVVHRPGDPQLRIHDAGAPLRLAGEGSGSCYGTDEHTVECFFTPPEIEVRTFDRDDRVELRGEPILRPTVRLGAGNDVGSVAAGRIEGEQGDDDITGPSLDGGEGDDRLTMLTGPQYRHGGGGPGDDVVTGSAVAESLSGGPGADEVRAGGGDDLLIDGDEDPGADDLYEGGEGRDELSYASRRLGVRVDLAAGTGGAADRDRLAGIEAAAGGDGADVLLGSDEADKLQGSPGDDTIDGRGGNDDIQDWAGDNRLAGGAGADTVRAGDGADVIDGGADDDALLEGGLGEDSVIGGPGNDVLAGGAGADALDGGDGDDLLLSDGDWFRDRLGCGPGADTVSADEGDDADPTCESVRRKAVAPLLRGHRLRGGRRTVPVVGDAAWLNPYPCGAPACVGSIELWVGGRAVARGRFSCGGTYETECLRLPFIATLRLPRTVRARVRRGRPVRAVVATRLGPEGAEGAFAVRERALLVRNGR